MSPQNPLQQLRRLGKPSPRVSAQIAAILNGPEYKTSVKTLQDEDVVWLVEYLDNVLRALDTTHNVFWICLRELRRICGIYGKLPKYYTPPGSLKVGGHAAVRGYYGDVHKGTLGSSEVRIKRLFTSDGAGQDFYEEAVTWRRLEHPNIVSLLGITITPSPPQLISDWILGANLTEYIHSHPGADKLCLLSGIASGLEYLHSNDVVHGSIKGPNILVDNSGRPRITDFGLAKILRNPAFKRAFLDDQSVRWAAPETLRTPGTYNKETDVFSFAMVMIEVFTGEVPFDTSQPPAAAIAILKGDCPPRPIHSDCSDELWVLMQRCWSREPRSRPKVSEVFQILPSSDFDRLQRLYMPGMASQEFQLALNRSYGSTDYQNRIHDLRGANLRKYVNFLDTVLRTKGLNQSLLQQTLHNLRKVCNHRAMIPSSLEISDDPRKSNSGSSEVSKCPEVWVGKFDRVQRGGDQNDVHVKVVKFAKTQKELYGEVATWAWLDHPNILRCFGITVNPLQVVTEWVPNGNVVEYLRTHHNADRICLLIDVVRGLDYLHSHGMIHCGLKSETVLVNSASRACISDIGFAAFAHNEEPDTDATRCSICSSRWTAPEVSKNGEFSKQSDVFSFGFVAVEILTGELLWPKISIMKVRSKIVDGERPHMPKGKVEVGITAELWGMLTKCWEIEAEERITISAVLSLLLYTPQPISGTSHNLEMATTQSQCKPGQDSIDELDKGWLCASRVLARNEVSDQERTKFLNILCKMCSRQRSVPKSMRITCRYSEQTTEHQAGYTSVFKGNDRGRSVAVNLVRLYLTNDPDTHLSRFCREAVAWKHLQHPNILPLLGVNFEKQKYAMISEWMDNGNVKDFIEAHKEANRAQLLTDAALGLEYMHNLQLAHGDLKGANILVTRDNRACLADFGLSTIVRGAQKATTGTSVASTTSLTSFTAGGTPRWMSPELLDPDRFGIKESRPTTQSDCYALGMTIYEILTGNEPYWEIAGEKTVEEILRGVRPKKPYAAGSLGFTDGLWRIAERSWVVDVDARPDVKAILYYLTHAASAWNRRSM